VGSCGAPVRALPNSSCTVRDGVPGAKVVREWTFPPQAVVTRNVGGGVIVEDVSAYLDYDPRTRRATVAVQGLKQPFEEEVDLTPELLQK